MGSSKTKGKPIQIHVGHAPSRPARVSWWAEPQTREEWYDRAAREWAERMRDSKESHKVTVPYMNESWDLRRKRKAAAPAIGPADEAEAPLDLRSTDSD